MGFALYMGYRCWPSLVSPNTWVDPLIFLACVILNAILGFFVGVLVGWPVLGPTFYGLALKNGEPFAPGELVHILKGPHRDRIVEVVEVFDLGAYANAHRIRVDLGPEAEEDSAVYCSWEILRVGDARPERADEEERA